MGDNSVRTPLHDLELNNNTPLTFCVTGSSGYIGGAIVQRLLQAGHVVRATVRGDPGDSRYDALRRLDSTGRQLQIYSANLSTTGSFDEAISGCHKVIHVASPVTLKVPPHKARDLVIQPALDGVRHVVAAIEKSGTVDTLVLTSSMSAVLGDNWERGQGHVYTEDDWNCKNTTEDRMYRFSYSASKTMAEKLAWELYETQNSKARRWRLVTILPGFVLGPPSTNVKSELVEFATLLMNGKVWPVIPDFEFSMVDLDDVAAAHIMVAVEQTCQGRYIIAQGGHTIGMHRLMARMRERFPRYRLPFMGAPKWILRIVSFCSDTVAWPLVDGTLKKPHSFDGSRIERDVGIKYKDPFKGFENLLNWIVDNGMAPDKRDTVVDSHDGQT